MTHGAKLGAVDFINDATWELMSTNDSAYAGGPQPRVSTLESQVLDGSIVIHDSDDNRTITFDVMWGRKRSGETRASAAKRVEYELGKRNTFIYSPSNGEPSASYQVQDSSWEYVSGDSDEAFRRGRWRLTLTCLPYAFSTTAVTDAALVGTGASDIVMADGTSATGWTSTFGTITASGGVLKLPVNGACHINATFAFTAVDFSTRPFVFQDIKLPPNTDLNTLDPGSTYFMQNAAGTSTSGKYVGATPAPTTGFTRLWFYFATPLTNATKLIFDLAWTASGLATLDFDNLTRTGSAPYLPNAQSVTSLRNILMKGSRRTPGSLAIDLQAASGVPWMAYTGPNLGFGGAYNPQIITTSSNISSTPATATVLVSGLPRGGYIVVVDASPTVVGQTLTWTATQTGAPSQTGSQTFDATGRQMATVGPIVLPLGDVSATSSASISFSFSATSGGGGVVLSAAFLLYMGPGAAVTMQNASTGRYVFINAATVDRPWPQVLSGSLADGSNAVSQVGVMSSVMRHNFVPPVQTCLIYAGGATAPTATLSYTPAFGDWPDQ